MCILPFKATSFLIEHNHNHSKFYHIYSYAFRLPSEVEKARHEQTRADTSRHEQTRADTDSDTDSDSDSDSVSNRKSSELMRDKERVVILLWQWRVLC